MSLMEFSATARTVMPFNLAARSVATGMHEEQIEEAWIQLNWPFEELKFHIKQLKQIVNITITI